VPTIARRPQNAEAGQRSCAGKFTYCTVAWKATKMLNAKFQKFKERKGPSQCVDCVLDCVLGCVLGCGPCAVGCQWAVGRAVGWAVGWAVGCQWAGLWAGLWVGLWAELWAGLRTGLCDTYRYNTLQYRQRSGVRA